MLSPKSNNSKKQQFEPSEDLVKLVAEVGFLASHAGMFAEAEAIFQGISQVRPESPAPAIGIALAHISCSQVDQAIKILEAAQAKPGSDPQVAAFLGLAYHVAGQAEKKDQLLSQVLQDSNKIAADFAQSLMDERKETP